MRPYPKSFLTAALLLVSAGLFAQETYQSSDADFLARLSYDRSAMPRAALDEVQRICVAVSNDGDYRIVRVTGIEIQQLHGKLPQEQFDRLKTLLASSDFRALSSDHGGLIRQQAESFGAEISNPGDHGEDGARRLQWLNADDESPFPGSIVKVIDWLKHFEPKDGKRFEHAQYPDVCPSGGLRLIQPSVAVIDRP